jgi:hypothetical protein
VRAALLISPPKPNHPQISKLALSLAAAASPLRRSVPGPEGTRLRPMPIRGCLCRLSARGDFGQDMQMESNSLQPIVLSSMAERTKFPAPGFAGGLGDVRIDGKKVDHRGQHVLEYGDHVLVSMSEAAIARPAHDRAPSVPATVCWVTPAGAAESPGWQTAPRGNPAGNRWDALSSVRFATDSLLEGRDLPPMIKRKKRGNNPAGHRRGAVRPGRVAPCSLCQGRSAPAPPMPPHSRWHP